MALREVVPDQTAPPRGGRQQSRCFHVSTGGSRSTLQEIELADGAGGFAYAADPHFPYTANRFIVWRASGDTLELTEESLDFRLEGNTVKYRFVDSPVLSRGGVAIYETAGQASVAVLVATVSAVHKLVFPHPRRIHKMSQHLVKRPERDGIPSVFADATAAQAKETYHIVPPANATSPLPNLAACWLSPSDEAMFLLSNSSGEIQLVQLANLKGLVTVQQLKSGSYLGRLWGNLMSKGDASAEAPASLTIQELFSDVYVFAICRDHKFRMWSTTSCDCVMAEDILSCTTSETRNLSPGSQSHLIRKVVDPNAKGLSLALFLCFAKQAKFCIVKPSRIDGQYQLTHVATIYAPELDLVDFHASRDHLWALWSNSDGIPMVRYATFSGGSDGSGEAGWTNVFLEEPLDPDLMIHPQGNFDPRQYYMREIFRPGRFSATTLTKTIGIYRRSLSTSNQLQSEGMSLSRLREEVCAAVEGEICNQVSSNEISEISDEEYLEVAHVAWAKFFSCAVQYRQAGLAPLGLIGDDALDTICLVKKSSLSFLRPVDALEQLQLSPDSSSADVFHVTPVLREDPALAADVVCLMRAAALVAARIPPAAADAFAHELVRLVSPDAAARTIARSLLSEDGDVAQALSTCLQHVGDIARAMEVLLVGLELDRGIVAHTGLAPPPTNENEKNVFASPMGVSVLAQTLNQVAHARFNLTRDLLVLQLLMLDCGVVQSADAAETIHSTLIPRAVVMAHCYFVLVWLNETPATAPPPNSLEQGLRQLAVLRINESNASNSFEPGMEALAQLARRSGRTLTLAELFLRGPGGVKSRSLLTSTEESAGFCGRAWRDVLMPLVNIAAQLLWPRCAVATLQQFLLSACQHMQIQEYVRLLSTWCDWNCHSRQFLLGSALLSMGEPEKASDWMVQAAGGIPGDKFLMQHLFGETGFQLDNEGLQVRFFLKVIELFQQFGYYDFVIDLAKIAMDVCDGDDPNRATLCYILFSHNLKLGHNMDAYDAMIMNPDRSRRKDSLRQFVVTLFERHQLKELASYPYIDMLDDLKQIVEARARSVDLTVNNYYDFLYSFHIAKENYRKAASVMFECGMRLGTEAFTTEGLNQQAKCYLACLNALSLVNEDYAWLVKPVPHFLYVPQEAPPDPLLPPGVSPKRSVDGEELLEVEPLEKPAMEVLERADIERELELVWARLKLPQSSSPTGPGMSAEEITSLLAAANRFNDAARLCRLFDLDPRPMLETLAAKCVRLSRADANAAEREAAWEWLPGESGMEANAAEAAWNFLENILERLEERGQSKLYRAVSAKLLSLGAVLPVWIIAKYKKVNAAELLRLYLTNGYLEDATMLACEFISAILGEGKEYFGLQTSLNANAPPVWLPINTLDQVIMELTFHKANPHYEKLLHRLNEKVQQYLDTVERVSGDMIMLKMQ